MATNPVLRTARRLLPGRFGIARFSDDDEHPLTTADVRELTAAFGAGEVRLAQMILLRIFDRNVLKFRWRAATRRLDDLDDYLTSKTWVPRSWSYHQVLTFERTATADSSRARLPAATA